MSGKKNLINIDSILEFNAETEQKLTRCPTAEILFECVRFLTKPE
jgi:hypothetical protein